MTLAVSCLVTMEIAFETWNLCGIENTKTEVATSPAENLLFGDYRIPQILTMSFRIWPSKKKRWSANMGIQTLPWDHMQWEWVKKCTKQFFMTYNLKRLTHTNTQHVRLVWSIETVLNDVPEHWIYTHMLIKKIQSGNVTLLRIIISFDESSINGPCSIDMCHRYVVYWREGTVNCQFLHGILIYIYIYIYIYILSFQNITKLVPVDGIDQ